MARTRREGASGGQLRRRADGRGPHELRPVRATLGYIAHAEGSALFELGNTRVVCTASVEDRVPDFLRNTGKGWLTAEYGMLPRATDTRGPREAARGRPSGRTQEIQRLIGRSLRAVTDLDVLGARTVWIDCDVIQADGGTRTAAITGAYLALAQAVEWLEQSGCVDRNPLRDAVAAVSVGMVNGRVLLDLAYAEDSRADVDMNFVMTGGGRLVEIQGTAEKRPFTKAQLDRMAAVAAEGIRSLVRFQRKALSETG